MAGIKIGIGFSVTRGGIPSGEQICEFAERVEDLGIDSIWPSDHIISRQPSLDVHALMALFAARTKKLKMGPSVLSLPPRDPIHVAKIYASLDHLSGGRRRVILAVGLGTDKRECEVSGIPVEERGARMREGVEVIRKLWSGANVSHQGRFYRFENISIEPLPVGGPLDVWIGGNSDLALKRVARYGDGWLPSFITPSEFADGMRRLATYTAETKRRIDADEAGVLMLTHASNDPGKAREIAERFLRRAPVPPEALLERCAIGTVEECVERIQSFVDAGCQKFVLFPIATADDLLEQVDVIGRRIVPRFS